MMKKKHFAILILGLLVGAILFFIFVINNKQKFNQTEKLAHLLEGYGAEIYLFGELKPIKPVNVKAITSISDETLKTENKNAYHLLIIADYDGHISLSDEELILARKYCEENHYDLFYFGMKRQEQLIRCGFKSYNGYPFLYRGYEFRYGGLPEFNGEEWFDSETNTYFADPFFIEMHNEYTSEMCKKNPNLVWEKILREALWSIEE